jgi:hypothetical protein
LEPEACTLRDGGAASLIPGVPDGRVSRNDPFLGDICIVMRQVDFDRSRELLFDAEAAGRQAQQHEQ